MAPSNRPPMREPRPRAKTPAERGADAHEAQRRLKHEAAERRQAAAQAAEKDQAAERPAS